MSPKIPIKTQTHLEWSEIRQHLSDGCQSEEGVKRARALSFAETYDELSARHQRTTEARTLIDEGHHLSIGALPDVRHDLSRAQRSAQLEPEAIVAIGRLLETSRRVTETLSSVDIAPTLNAFTASLYVNANLEDECIASFDEDLQLVNGASPTLRKLRQQTEDLHANLRTTLNRFLTDEDILPMLQEDYFTLRDERYVLPLKARHKNHIDGIVHGWSQTGATVYVEPARVIEANNRLMLAQAETDAEVSRILREMSASIGAMAKALVETFNVLTTLDVIWAMGSFSKRLDAAPPHLNASGSLEFIDFRHPLLILSSQDVIPNTIRLDENQPALVITGPNTGGKTVALKSVGLLLLMGHAGLHIPATVSSFMPFVPGIFSDIGDEQSLASQHSTFSGHIDNLKFIINEVSPGCLVLLDELVVGTDPKQVWSL